MCAWGGVPHDTDLALGDGACTARAPEPGSSAFSSQLGPQPYCVPCTVTRAWALLP